MRKNQRVAMCICMAGMLSLTACGKTTDVSQTVTEPVTAGTESVTETTAQTEEEAVTMGITSESLNDEGRWLTVCSKDGGNMSPELSFDAVEGAAEYAVYLYDHSAGEWLHWKETGITQTHLEQGQFADRAAGYVGPYPPSGSGDHEYEIVVYALKQSPDEIGGTLDSMCNIDAVEKKLDTAGGAEGNIISRFGISGLYAAGDQNQ